MITKIDQKISDSRKNKREDIQTCSWFIERILELLNLVKDLNPENITKEQEEQILEAEVRIIDTSISNCNSTQKANSSHT